MSRRQATKIGGQGKKNMRESMGPFGHGQVQVAALAHVQLLPAEPICGRSVRARRKKEEEGRG
jgi:hypothetical protein